MSKKENIISPSDEVKIVNAFKYWYETNTEKGVTSIPDYICKGLLDLYQQEKEKNKFINEVKAIGTDDTVNVVLTKSQYVYLLERATNVFNIEKDKVQIKGDTNETKM